MSSEILGSGQNVLKGNLGGAWDIKHGYADAYTDLGIARRFGGATAAYSLRDIGAMNGRVVRVRREPTATGDDELDFTANQVESGALEEFVQAGTDYSAFLGANFTSAGETPGADDVFSSHGKDGFRGASDSSGDNAFFGVQLASTVSSSTVVYVSFTLSGTVPNGGISLRQNTVKGTIGQTSADTSLKVGFNSVALTANATSAFISFVTNEGNSAEFTISNFKADTTSRNGFVTIWYDQSTNGNNCTQSSESLQPFIVDNGGFCGVFMKEISGGEPNASNLRIDEIQTTDLGNNFGLIWVGSIDSSYAVGEFTTLVGANRNISTRNVGTIGLNIKLSADEFTITNEDGTGVGDTVTSGSPTISYTPGDRVSVAGTCVGPDGDGDHTLKAYANNATPVSNNDTLVLTDSGDDLRIMASNFSNTVRRSRSTIGKVDEVIIFASNIEPDIEDLRTEINNYYNIY